MLLDGEGYVVEVLVEILQLQTGVEELGEVQMPVQEVTA